MLLWCPTFFDNVRISKELSSEGFEIEKKCIQNTTNSNLPFIGGWFVYLSYELIGQIEPVLATKLEKSNLPIAYAVRVPTAIYTDHKIKKTFIYDEEDDQSRINTILSDIETLEKIPSNSIDGHISEENEEKIARVAKEGTQNIIDSISDNCKIIMPSTHVVYEGMKDVQEDIQENKQTCPELAYGKSKDFNETQLKSSGKNYIILRLGSVYGYSTDSMRIDIMPNLFSKIASQDGTLKLFAGGRQIKSLVPLIDVARCFKFMEEKNEIHSEVFNLTKETLTVKEVAEICKKYNPKTTLKETLLILHLSPDNNLQ